MSLRGAGVFGAPPKPPQCPLDPHDSLNLVAPPDSPRGGGTPSQRDPLGPCGPPDPPDLDPCDPLGPPESLQRAQLQGNEVDAKGQR